MKAFMPLFEMILIMNFLLLISTAFIKNKLFSKKPTYQLFLARLLFISCIISPIAIHFINFYKENFIKISPSHILKESTQSFLNNNLYENFNDVVATIGYQQNIDFTYLYFMILIVFISGMFYRISKIIKDINKTKLIIDLAQHYKKYGKIIIKISDQCLVPFSIRFPRFSYIILPVSILYSSVNTKLAIAHEGQHHRQGDCLWAYLIEFARIFFWFNPSVNYWQQKFHELQELACDETLVSKKSVSAHDYGSCLFKVTQQASHYLHDHNRSLACTAQMIFGHKNDFALITRRICMLSEYKSTRPSKTMRGFVLSLSVLSVSIPLTTAFAAKGMLPRDGLNSSIDLSSINPKIQKIAAKEIISAVNKSNAKSGAIVIADAQSGKIVAFAEAGKSTLSDSWSSRIFNPASTIKPFIAAAAIDTGAVSQSTVLDCHEPYQVDGKQFKNGTSGNNQLSLSDAMASSNNICMIKVAQRAGPIKVRQTLTGFGFDMNSAWKNHNSDALNLANATIGTSIPVTLNTLTNAFIILAHKGHGVHPNSISIVSENTASTVTQLLEKTVAEGTGKRASIATVSVAGKTGTLSNEAHTSLLALFAGYVPSNSPRYISIVVIENGQINGSKFKANGGNIAAPVFKKVLEKSLAVSE